MTHKIGIADTMFARINMFAIAKKAIEEGKMHWQLVETNIEHKEES